jgi:hypothetical protein
MFHGSVKLLDSITIVILLLVTGLGMQAAERAGTAVSSALNGVQHGVQLFGETGGFGRH